MLSGCVKAPKGEAVIEIFDLNCYFGWILTNLSPNPIAASEIKRHKPEWGSPDHCLGSPHKVGSENLSNVIEYLLVKDAPEVRGGPPHISS